MMLLDALTEWVTFRSIRPKYSLSLGQGMVPDGRSVDLQESSAYEYDGGCNWPDLTVDMVHADQAARSHALYICST